MKLDYAYVACLLTATLFSANLAQGSNTDRLAETVLPVPECPAEADPSVHRHLLALLDAEIATATEPSVRKPLAATRDRLARRCASPGESSR